MELDGNNSTHIFDWSIDSIFFQSLHDHFSSPPDDSYVIESWVYTGDDIPPAGEENMRINMWLNNGNSPSDGQEAEVIIKKFEYTQNDTTSPIITNIANTVPTTDSVTITWDTDENSDSLVRYDTVPGTYTDSESNTSMATSHIITLTGLNPETTYYFVVNSTDADGNSNQSVEYRFITAAIPDTTAPSSITNLHSTIGTTHINWTWTNPPDPDFNHTEIYLNGTPITNIPAPQNYYNATGLLPDTSYELGTHTVDTAGNVNETWVNDTTKTTIASGGGITGTVTNETGSPITEVMVKLTDYSQYNATTASDGRYIINNVPEGTYSLTATKDPEYYPNSSVVINSISGSMVVQDIELVKKLTGTISGNVVNVLP